MNYFNIINKMGGDPISNFIRFTKIYIKQLYDT